MFSSYGGKPRKPQSSVLGFGDRDMNLETPEQEARNHPPPPPPSSPPPPFPPPGCVSHTGIS